MSRYSVICESEKIGCNSICGSIGEVMDIVFDALKREETVTITEIPPEPLGEPPKINKTAP